MQDDFLKAFNEQRALRAERDRSFQIDGVTLTHRPAVAPEIPLLFAETTDRLAVWADEVNRLLATAKNGDQPALPEQPVSEAQLIEVYERTVLACLDPASDEAWQKLRAPDAPNPLTGEDIYRLAVYLIGRTTQIPTDGLLGSSATQPEAERTSRGSSRSRGRKPTTSIPS